MSTKSESFGQMSSGSIGLGQASATVETAFGQISATRAVSCCAVTAGKVSAREAPNDARPMTRRQRILAISSPYRQGFSGFRIIPRNSGVRQPLGTKPAPTALGAFVSQTDL